MVLISGAGLFCACVLRRLSMLTMIREMYPINRSVIMNFNTQLVFFIHLFITNGNTSRNIEMISRGRLEFSSLQKSSTIIYLLNLDYIDKKNIRKNVSSCIFMYVLLQGLITMVDLCAIFEWINKFKEEMQQGSRHVCDCEDISLLCLYLF